MRFNFAFTTPQILWTLTFAAQLVLLVVLVGLQRLRRFPWFTVSVFVIALRAVAAELLTTRIATFALQELLVALDTLTALIMLLVVVELARRAFARTKRRNWWWSFAAVFVIAIAATAAWGHWPSWYALTADPATATLRVMNFAASRINLLGSALTIELCLLVLLFGSRFKAGWRSHAQQILIGLSTAAIAQIIVVTAFRSMSPPHTRNEQTHQLAFIDAILNANSTIYIVVLIWWIGCLWLEEPAAESAATLLPVAETITKETETQPTPAPELMPAAESPAAPPIEFAVSPEEAVQAPAEPVAAEAPPEPAITPLPAVERAQTPAEPVTFTAKPKRSNKPPGAPAGKQTKKQPANKTSQEISAIPLVAAPVKVKKAKAAKPAEVKAQAAAAEPPSNAAPQQSSSPAPAPRKNRSATPKRKKNSPPAQAE